MPPQVVFLFSGQGSQYPAMGRELYESHATYRAWLEHCSELVEGEIGTRLTELIFRTPAASAERPARAVETGPAICAVNYAMAQTLLAEGCRPDVLLGYSLGEMTAAAFSGHVPLETILGGIVRSARLLETRTPRADMLAVLDSIDRHKPWLARAQDVHLATINFDGSFVVVGLPEPIRLLRESLASQGVLTQPLPVHRGFHSPLIDPVEQEHLALLRTLDPAPGWVRIVSSVYGRALAREDVSARYFWDVIRHPVDFRRAVEWLEREGPWLYLDVGPSGTLATFVKYQLRPGSGSKALPVLDQFGQNRKGLDRVLRALRE